MPVSPQKLYAKLALKLNMSPKGSRFKSRRITTEEDIVPREGDLPPLPPAPPPKDHRQSWISTYCAYQVAEAAAFTRSSSDSSSSVEAADQFGRHLLARQVHLTRAQSNRMLSPDRRNASLPPPPGTHPPLRPPMQSLTLPPPSRIPQRRPRERRTASTPDEIEVRRLQAAKAKEREEDQARREEAERQARLKREKEEILRRAMEEDMERKLALEEELRRAAEQKRKREAVEREAEALKQMMVAEKKRKDKERRLEEARKAQAWRREQALLAQENQQKREAQRRKTLLERQDLASRLKLSSSNGVIFSGWVTIQAEESAPWKRRYFDLTDKHLLLFKNAEDTAQPLDTINLSEIRHVKEWHEGFEELEGVPHSFAVQFRTGAYWSMFADSELDKEYLLALLSQEMTE